MCVASFRSEQVSGAFEKNRPFAAPFHRGEKSVWDFSESSHAKCKALDDFISLTAEPAARGNGGRSSVLFFQVARPPRLSLNVRQRKMGSSFVQIKENGFWIRDGILELWLRLLSLHIEDPKDRSSRTFEIRDRWLLASRGDFSGCVPAELDEAVREEEGRRVVVFAIRSLISAVKKGPKTLDRGVLNLMGVIGEYCSNKYVERLLAVGQAFLDLIDGKIDSTAADTSFMPATFDHEKANPALEPTAPSVRGSA